VELKVSLLRIHWKRALAPNDPKLSDGGDWRDSCAGEGGGGSSQRDSGAS
jgi:hypothetical protein